jgi:uncharacterized Zn finger protein (UPF0148 family)
MKQLICEICGSTDLIKHDGVFVCEACGCKYSVEEAKKMMIEGTVDVSGSTVKVDNSVFVEKYLANARRALAKDDWEEVERYYNMVEQNSPNNMEAVFFSSFGKAMLSLTDSEYYKRKQKFDVLNKSISVINDYYEVTTEDKEKILRQISDAIQKMFGVEFVFNPNETGQLSVGSRAWTIALEDSVRSAFLVELKQIQEVHKNEHYIEELISKNSVEHKAGCYVATCVYGSYDCPQVWTLRRYRDYTLAETWHGRAFIRVYYAVSPTIVKMFGNTKWFKKMWQGRLDKMVANLRVQGIEDTPYEDRNW